MRRVSGYHFGRVEVTDDSEDDTGDEDVLASDNDSNY